MASPRDEFANIPILLEPMAEQDLVASLPVPIRPLPGREAQQPLFDDLPEGSRIPRAAVRRVRAPTTLSNASSNAAPVTLPLPGTSSETD